MEKSCCITSQTVIIKKLVILKFDHNDEQSQIYFEKSIEIVCHQIEKYKLLKKIQKFFKISLLQLIK